MADALGRYATRDNATGTDKTTSHAYGDLYSRIFEPYRVSAKNVLEIGVYSGASVTAFADFFEGARIVGLDITLDNVVFGIGHPRIAYVTGDGTRPVDAIRDREFDVILDDASHVPDDQVASLEALAPSLAPGGIYVIEDIRESGLYPGLAQVAARHGLEMEWHDLRSLKGQFDDVVAVFRKKPSV